MARTSNQPGCGSYFVLWIILVAIASWIEGATFVGPWFIWLSALGSPLLFFLVAVDENTNAITGYFERLAQRQAANNSAASLTKHSNGSRRRTGPTSASHSVDLLGEEATEGLQKDTSARFIVPENNDERIRFVCDAFQAETTFKRTEMFFVYARRQAFEPIQVGTHGTVEWWWFRDNFYKVEFEPGRPSAALAAELAADETYLDKASILDSFPEEGYSPDEVAEGVFEMEGITENALEHADRLDMSHTITVQAVQASRMSKVLAEQDASHDLELEQDDNARVFVEKTWRRTRVCMESRVHQPPQVLVDDDTVFKSIAELQNHHPILVDKKTARGRLWRSEVVAEWWGFKGKIYLAQREKGHQSEALALLKDELTRSSLQGKSEAWIPKWTVGNEFEELYEEGYAPEEIARLILALEGERESLEGMVDRVQAAKNAISESPNFPSNFQAPWNVTGDRFKREQVEEYLQERKVEGRDGIKEVREGGYWFNYREWERRRSQEFWSRVRDNKNTSAPKITGAHSLGSKPRREHIPKSVKMYVWQRDGGKCVNCGSNEKLEYDHIIPLAKGGSNTDRNIQLLCERCNRSKGASIT